MIANLFGEKATAIMKVEEPVHAYAGKWTIEEEEYVGALTEEFLSGTLNIPEGTSLRTFLAKMLGCKVRRYEHI